MSMPAEIAAMMATNPFRAALNHDGTISNQIVTCPVRVNYIAVDKLYPSKKYPNRRPEASVSMIIPPGADLNPFNTLVKQIATAHFGASVLAGPCAVREGMAPASVAAMMRKPLKPQATYKGKDGFTQDGSGFWLRAGSDRLPRIIDRNKAVIPNDSPELYAGMWALALLRLYAYPKQLPTSYTLDTIYGVNVGLVQLQKIADDSRIATGGNVDDMFGVIAHTGAAPGVPMVAAPADGIPW